MDQVNIMIADDHSEFRQGLRALLESVDSMCLVGEASTGAEAVSLAARLQPDVLLMDLNMPGLNGIDATRRILHHSPHIAVLMLTMFDDDDSIFAAVRAGARGYVLKGALKAEILRAIRVVASGEAIFGAGIAQRLMHFFAASRPPAPPETFPELTERERQILSLMAQHLSNPEIAQRLVITDKTVRNTVSNILDKLQVTDRAQAILRARDAGLGAP